MGAVCTDQNPCTDDVCGTNGCVSTPKAAGQPGNASEGACVGVCQTDGACGLRLYSRTFPAAGNWTPNPPALSTVWTGPNAPPPRGILDAAHAYADSRLFVWADNGMFYQQSGGTWMPPVPTATAFPGLGATNLGCAEVWQPNAGGPLSVLLAATGTTPRQAFVYSISALGTITADGANPYTITPTADPEGAPQDTVDCDWSLQVQNAYVGSPGWVIFWRHYGDKVYEYDGSSDNWIANWLDVGSPLWAGSNPPAPNSVAGAYYNQLTAYLIAP